MRVAVIGAGGVGSAAARFLAAAGHEVTVLERDAASVPASATEAWERWDRVGVPQFRQPHNSKTLRCAPTVLVSETYH